MTLFLSALWRTLTKPFRPAPVPAIQPAPPTDWHEVKASSFADPADVAAFERCKARGGSDLECFAVGDNGIGCWGDHTARTTLPICALPPEDMNMRWGSVAKARHRRVRVRANAREIICMLGDRMPARKNIRNGAGIDLNPIAAASLGLKPPFLVPASWAWEEDVK